jgi:hypothetical protein
MASCGEIMRLRWTFLCHLCHRPVFIQPNDQQLACSKYMESPFLFVRFAISVPLTKKKRSERNLKMTLLAKSRRLTPRRAICDFLNLAFFKSQERESS